MSDIKADLVKFFKARALMDDQTDLADSESITGAGIIDSIGILQLLDHIEEKYGLEIPMELITIENFDSLEAIESLIRKLSGKAE